MKKRLRCLFIPVLAVLSAGHVSAKTPAPAGTTTLIVPGEGIGGIRLGGDAAKVRSERGKEDEGERWEGGVMFELWYLGAKHGDKGRMFHRPDEIRLFAHYNESGRNFPIYQVEVTSPRFATAEGIAPGSTLDAIRAKFPDIVPDDKVTGRFWPQYGEMQFFKDVKRGIAFAVRKNGGVCVQIDVMPREGSEPLVWVYPKAAWDYMVHGNEGLGDVRLGITDTKLLALLGKPDEKGGVIGGLGVIWRWRIPSQRPADLPALCVYLRELPNGVSIVDQIRVSSPAFLMPDSVFPGCTLNDVRDRINSIAKQEGYKEAGVDIYGEPRWGLLFDVRQSDSVCTAITIFSGPRPVEWYWKSAGTGASTQPEK